MQVIKNQPDLSLTLPNPSLVPKENLNYMCRLIKPRALHLFNILNTPQWWSISLNTKYAEQLQSPIVNNNIIPT